MAERTISTRLILSGEKEYRAQIKQLNAEYKTLQSELKLVDSNFKGQQNTLEALQQKNKALTDAISKQSEVLKTENRYLDEARKHKSDYAAAAEQARTKMEQLTSTTDEAAKETNEYKQSVAAAQADINKYEAAEQKAAAAVEAHSKRANEAQVKLNDLNRALSDNEKYLDEAKSSADGCASSIDEFGKQTKEAASESKDFGRESSEAVDALANALAAAGVAKSIEAITEALWDAVDASIEFESAMAGVAKTTNLSAPELEEMAGKIKELSLTVPIAADEIAGIAEAAGQLGIAKRDLVDFAEVMANLGVATNMTSEEAATMLAQFANITGMDTSMYQNLGSAIVALGNSFATNEQRITEFAQTVAGAGVNAGMSETSMLALGAAVTSLGIESATGGSNMSKLISAMQTAVQTGEGLNDWAEAAGVSAAEFSALWGQDAAQAILRFVQGVSSTGRPMGELLDNLGMGELRTSRMITSLVNAEKQTQLLSRALNLSNTAWAENTALLAEAETRYSTTESKIQLYENSVQNLKIAVGDQLTPALGNLADAGADVMNWATELIATNPEIVTLTTSLLAAGAAFSGLAVGIPLVAKALVALKSAMATTPYGLAAAAIGAVVAALVTLIATSESAIQATLDLADAMSDAQDARQEAIAATQEEALNLEALGKTLADLSAKEEKTETDRRMILQLVEQLNEAVPDLALAYDEEADALVNMASGAEMTAEALQKMVQAESQRLVYEERVQALIEAQAAEIRLTDELAAAKDRLAASQDGAGFATIALGSAMTESQLAYRQAAAEVAVLEEALAAQQAEIEELTAATEGYTQTTVQGMTEAEQKVSSAAATLQEEYRMLSEAYATSFAEAYENASKTAGMFNELNGNAKATIGDLMDALDSQITFFNKYAENIKKAMEMGVDEGLIKQLSDGSEESAQILQAIVEDGEGKIDELNEKLRTVQEGKTDFADQVAELETDFKNRSEEILYSAQNMVYELNRNLSNFDASSMIWELDRLIDKIYEANRAASSSGNLATKLGGAHAAGLDYVPYDDYVARLHEGEMVLTKLQARAYRAQQNMVTNNSTSSQVNISVDYHGDASPSSARAAGTVIGREIQQQLRLKGVVLVG